MEETNAPATKSKKRRPRRTEKEGLALVHAFRESGLSRAKFCAQEGVGIWLLNYWTSRERAKGQVESSRFIPVQVEPGQAHRSLSGSDAVELRCGNVRCSIPSELGADFLAKVLTSLAGSKKVFDDLR